METENLTFLEVSTKLAALYTQINKIEYNIKIIDSKCANLKKQLQSNSQMGINIATVYNAHKKGYEKIMEEIYTSLKECENIYKKDKPNDDKTITPFTALEGFINIERECPICYEAFNIKFLVFAPCSHFCCLQCYNQLRSNDCHICRKNIDVYIQYDKTGENLQFITYPPKKNCNNDDSDNDDDDDDLSLMEYDPFGYTSDATTEIFMPQSRNLTMNNNTRNRRPANRATTRRRRNRRTRGAITRRRTTRRTTAVATVTENATTTRRTMQRTTAVEMITENTTDRRRTTRRNVNQQQPINQINNTEENMADYFRRLQNERVVRHWLDHI